MSIRDYSYLVCDRPGLWNKNTNYLKVMAPGRTEAFQTVVFLLKEFLSATRFLKPSFHIFNGQVGSKAHGMKGYCHLPAIIEQRCSGKKSPRKKRKTMMTSRRKSSIDLVF